MNWLRRWRFPRRFAIGIGLILAATTLVVHIYIAGFEYGYGLAPGILWQFWIIAGSFLLGAISAFVSTRYRVVSPVLTAVGMYGSSLAVSWSALVDSAESSGAGLTPTPFELVIPFWFLPLIIGFVLGGIEYGIRYLLRPRR